METATSLGLALLSGGLGGLLVYALFTLFSHPRGDISDHEERLSLLEGLVRTLQREGKARKMRELRSAEGDFASGKTDQAQASFPQIETKDHIRARLAAARRVNGRG